MKKTVHSIAKWFFPHRFEPQVRLLGVKPRIFLTREVYETMYYIVQEAPNEFGWFCLVDRIGNDFTLTECFILEQTVSQVTVDIAADPSSNPMGELFLHLIRTRGSKAANSVKAWIHSHVNMGVTPSGSYQFGDRGDLNQMYQFGQNGAEYFIMGIANKHGELRFEIFFYDLGYRVVDVPWEMIDKGNDALRKQVSDEVKAKTITTYVSPKVVQKKKVKVKSGK